MKINDYCIEGETFPDLYGGEFKTIRRDAGITLEQFANIAGKRSRTTAYNWECREKMKPWQTNLLMNMVPAPIFLLARRKWRKRNDNYVKKMTEYYNKQKF